MVRHAARSTVRATGRGVPGDGRASVVDVVGRGRARRRRRRPLLARPVGAWCCSPCSCSSFGCRRWTRPGDGRRRTRVPGAGATSTRRARPARARPRNAARTRATRYSRRSGHTDGRPPVTRLQLEHDPQWWRGVFHAPDTDLPTPWATCRRCLLTRDDPRHDRQGADDAGAAYLELPARPAQPRRKPRRPA